MYCLLIIKGIYENIIHLGLHLLDTAAYGWKNYLQLIYSQFCLNALERKAIAELSIG